MSKSIALIMVDGPADWEYAPVMAAAHAWFGMKVTSATEDGEPVTSIGGMRIVPHRRISELDSNEADLWILPGSDAWAEKPIPGIILAALETRVAAGRPVAGICGATLALAQAGLLQSRPHTSNSLAFLQENVPDYVGSVHYREQHCVSDGVVVSAPGTAPISFAVECLRILAPGQQAAIDEFRAAFAREWA
ncbi:putative intracellular protease/amidase [Luteimonas cucumeris]|uniref:Putative intracellular protease/amidase n=1 Tax=Luteimonas cucumeris TaxID=985012 RepID=A0A562L4V0_9GAMM|nr:type 1 glutamine amidotransferase family protein [Luteimonas cucumeris]TWI02692.1 putative intracellular protease/amidase [Luteimonas cucumeris]